MRKQMRIFWLISLVIFTAGCSGYRTTYYPNLDMQENMEEDMVEDTEQPWPETCPFEPGDNVVVTLLNGEQTEGKVELISSEEIVLNRDERSLQPRGYAMDQVHSIQKKNETSPDAGAIIGVTLGLVVAGGIIAANELSKLDNMFGN
jgi:hypothetical protein